MLTFRRFADLLQAPPITGQQSRLFTEIFVVLDSISLEQQAMEVVFPIAAEEDFYKKDY